MRSPGDKLEVILVMRAPALGQFSVERMFRDVLYALPEDIEASLVHVPYPSRGVLPRIRNVIFTARLKADVIHITGDVQYCALASQMPTLLTVLDLVSVFRLSGWKRKFLLMLWYKLPIRRVNAVTTLSDAVRDELLQLVPSAGSKTTAIGCPVGGVFATASESRSEPEGFRVLLIGTTPNKNLRRIATALEGLPLHIHLIGTLDEGHRDVMDNLGLSYSHATNLSDPEMRCAYQRSSVLLFASTYEGFGLPILEAQACGTPVITSNLRPMSDVAGDGAILVDPYDPLSIRRGVEVLLTDGRARTALRRAGLANVARFSITGIAMQYADTYRRITGGSVWR